jgi:16S rRNA (cytosine1407-C5)-methyltransferase
MTEVFDRVLCDAPCTAQGTVRKDSDALTYCSIDNIGKMARLQRELLEAAVHSAKVGGTIVYSTCTLTPEENEDVVLSILNKFSDQLEVVDPHEVISDKREVMSDLFDRAIHDSQIVQQSLKGHFQFSILNFQFLRLWPQTFDTEGFFVAVLRKRAPTRAIKPELPDMHRFSVLPQARMKEVLLRIEDWFGSPFLRENEVLLETKDQLLVVPESALHGRLRTTPYLVGLPFGKPTNHGLLRLSHEMATLRGREATEQVLSITQDQLSGALAGKDIPVTDSQGVDDGDVLLSIADPSLSQPLIVGRGMLKAGKVLNRLPREIVRMFS